MKTDKGNKTHLQPLLLGTTSDTEITEEREDEKVRKWRNEHVMRARSTTEHDGRKTTMMIKDDDIGDGPIRQKQSQQPGSASALIN